MTLPPLQPSCFQSTLRNQIVSFYHCGSGSDLQVKVEGPLMGAVLTQQALQGSETMMNEVAGRNKSEQYPIPIC